MEDSLRVTMGTYRDSFNKYEQQTSTEPNDELRKWIDAFMLHIPRGGSVLEIGSATGRDARYFRKQGYKVLCTDIIPQALQKLSLDGFDVAEFDFTSEQNVSWNGKFDGIFANAVLLHADETIFRQALSNLKMYLQKDGYIAFSVMNGSGEELTLRKMDAPRYFYFYNEEKIQEIMNELSFEIVDLQYLQYKDSKKWIHVIAKVR